MFKVQSLTFDVKIWSDLRKDVGNVGLVEGSERETPLAEKVKRRPDMNQKGMSCRASRRVSA